VSTLLSRWVVCEDVPVSGPITQETLSAWVGSATEAYLERCQLLHRAGLTVNKRILTLPPIDRLIATDPESVAVSASASEVHPDSFTLSVRIRSAHDAAVNAKCVVTLTDPATGERQQVTNDIRDELIALEHAAQHFN
jgi:hypothetical protein